MTARVYVTFDEDRYGGEPLTDEDWSDRAPGYIEVSFKALWREKPSSMFGFTSYEVDPKKVDLSSDFLWLSVIRYSDGDTFGTTSGYWTIVGLSNSSAEAQEKIKLALSSKDGYKPWVGYFSNYDDAEFIKVSFSPDSLPYKDWALKSLLT